MLEKCLRYPIPKKPQTTTNKSYVLNKYFFFFFLIFLWFFSKEKLAQQITDTVNIFHNIRDHLNSNKKPKLFSKNSAILSSSKKKNETLSHNNSKSILTSKNKENNTFDKNIKNTLLFKTIPSEKEQFTGLFSEIKKNRQASESNKIFSEKKEGLLYFNIFCCKNSFNFILI